MRADWIDLPAGLRNAIEVETGLIQGIEPTPGGNHANIACTVHTANGRMFVKAARKLSDRDGPEVRSLRWEAAVNPHVTEFAPRLRWRVEAGDWFSLGFEHVTGRRADLSPGSSDLATLAKTIHAIQATPCPEVVKMLVERRWQTIAQDVSPMAGPALLHTDLNEENLIITPAGRAYVVDWAFAARGAAWVELGLLIPWLLKSGHNPAETDDWLAQFGSWAEAKPAHVDLFSAVFAEKWRANSQSNPAAWVQQHAALTKQWAEYRLS
jgi:hypothetical protein